LDEEHELVAVDLLNDIFSTFREARRQGSTEGFSALQDKIAAHAGDLVQLRLSTMKDLVDTLLKLEGAAADDGETGHTNEQKLQAFLRKAEDSMEVQ
jgi:hypothetical protein